MDLLTRITSFFAATEPSRPGPQDDYWYRTLGLESPSGIKVTPDVAIKASAVYACVKFLAETIASLPLVMMQRLDDGHRTEVPTHPLEELLRYAPNERQTAVEFWETIVMHSALWGNGYAEIIPGPRGPVGSLEIHHPDLVRVEMLPDRQFRFRVRNPRNATERVLLPEEMFRIPGLSSDGLTGMRAVDIAADAIGLGLAADSYAARIFSNNLNIGGFLEHPGKLSKEGQANLIDSAMRQFAGPKNSHRPMVLQEGLKFAKGSQGAKESQLLEARKWQIGEVARFWRIPLHMLGIFDGATHSNVEQQALDLVKYTLRPWCKRIELAIRRDLIIAKQVYFVKFNLEGLLRGEAKARSEVHKAALGSGGHQPWMSLNEVRRIENLNPVEGGDEVGKPAGQPTLAPEPPAAALPPPVAAITDQSIRSTTVRLVRQEIGACRKAASRFVGDREAFNEWARGFFGGHVSKVEDMLGVTHTLARSYCDRLCVETTGAVDIENYLVRREDEALETLNGA